MTKFLVLALAAAACMPTTSFAAKENLKYLKGVNSIVVDETLGNTCAIMNLSPVIQPSAIFPAMQKVMAQTPGVSVVSAQNVAEDNPHALTVHFTFSSFSETVGGETRGAGALTMQMTKKAGAEVEGIPLAVSLPFPLPDNCREMQARLEEATLQLAQYLPGYIEQSRSLE